MACTGVHGANRLASNSLLEALVFGRRIMTRTLEETSSEPRSGNIGEPLYLSLEEASSPKMAAEPPSVASLEALMWKDVGIVRSKESLEKAKAILAGWQRMMPSEPTDRPSHELANMILTGQLITQAALAREESRGAHFRTDFPQEAEKWRRHIVFRS